MDNYQHYARPSEDGVIRNWFVDGINGNFTQGDILVDDNGPRQFIRIMISDRRQFLYKLESGSIVFRTQAELDAEISALPPEPPSLQEQISAMQQVINLLLEV